MESKKPRLYPVYILATIGDLAIILLSIIGIFYGTKIGFSTIEVGLIGSAYGVSYLIMPAILGRITDKLSRKTSLIIATSSHIVLASILLLFISQPKEIVFLGFFLILLLYGVMFGFFWPTIEAYLSENTEHSPKTHKIAISNFCISWSIGYALGPFFAGILTEFNIIFAILFALTLFIISFSLVLILLPSSKYMEASTKSTDTEDKNKSLMVKNSSITIDRLTLLLLIGMIIYALIEKVILLYFPNYGVLINGLGWSESLTGQVMLSFGIGRTLFFIIGRFHDNNLNAITQSFIALTCCLIFLVFLIDPIIISVVFFILGFFIGRIYLVSLELLMKFEQEGKGGKAGLFESIIGLGSAFAPIIAGILASISLILPFLIFGLLTGLTSIVHFMLKRNIKCTK